MRDDNDGFEDTFEGKCADHSEDSFVDKADPADREAILITLDQISQTIEVMNSLVRRLRSYVEAQEAAQDAGLRAAMRSDRILH